jgi:predicted Zn-dependent peptidase
LSRRRSRRGALLTAALLLGTAPALLPVLAPPALAQALEGRVKRVTLDNGMRFLIVRRGTAPVFSAVLRFKVGSVDDRGGATGMAHLFEHLAFKGTSVIGTRDARAEEPALDAVDRAAIELEIEIDRGLQADPKRIEALRAQFQSLQEKAESLVVKEELSRVLTGNGAAGLNASTGADLTSYVVSLPANRLELWCLIESARLRDPVLREFYSERDVVMEERRMRLDSQPAGRLYEQLLLTAFQISPYRVPTVGYATDLEHLTRPEALAFRHVYYVPNNAVGTIVGDVDPVAAEKLLRRYFGGLAPGAPPPAPRTGEPPQSGERRTEVAFDAEPEVMIAFHKPTWPDPDDAVFRVIDEILTTGRSSRLFRALVLGSQVASDVSSFEAPGDRFPNLFVFRIEPRAPHPVAEAQNALLAELRRLAETPVSEDEMQKARNQLDASFLYPLRSNQGLASQLSYYEILQGDWKDLLRYHDALRAVSAARVQEVARRTFVPSNMTVVSLARPAGAAAGAPAAGAPAPGGAASGGGARGGRR